MLARLSRAGDQPLDVRTSPSNVARRGSSCAPLGIRHDHMHRPTAAALSKLRRHRAASACRSTDRAAAMTPALGNSATARAWHHDPRVDVLMIGARSDADLAYAPSDAVLY